MVECGAGHWDEQDHDLDIPHGFHTTVFKIAGTGHELTERAFNEGCRTNWQLAASIWASASWRSPPACASTLALSSCSTRRLALRLSGLSARMVPTNSRQFHPITDVSASKISLVQFEPPNS